MRIDWKATFTANLLLVIFLLGVFIGYIFAPVEQIYILVPTKEEVGQVEPDLYLGDIRVNTGRNISQDGDGGSGGDN